LRTTKLFPLPTGWTWVILLNLRNTVFLLPLPDTFCWQSGDFLPPLSRRVCYKVLFSLPPLSRLCHTEFSSRRVASRVIMGHHISILLYHPVIPSTVRDDFEMSDAFCPRFAFLPCFYVVILLPLLPLPLPPPWK